MSLAESRSGLVTLFATWREGVLRLCRWIPASAAAAAAVPSAAAAAAAAAFDSGGAKSRVPSPCGVDSGGAESRRRCLWRRRVQAGPVQVALIQVAPSPCGVGCGLGRGGGGDNRAGRRFPGCCCGGDDAGLVRIHRWVAAGGRGRPTVRIVAIAASSARPDLFALVLLVFIKSVHKLFLVQQFSPAPCFLVAEFPKLLPIRRIFPH